MIIFCVIIIGVGVGGVFWIYQYLEKQLQGGFRLVVVVVQEVEMEIVKIVFDFNVKKICKQIIEDSQKKVVMIESGIGLGLGFFYNDKGDVIINVYVVEGFKEVMVCIFNYEEY